jgi:two-component system, OmpR family, phosphate regulon sensor histidine kinase PhoR
VEFATSEAIAKLLTRDREVVLSEWEASARALPGTSDLSSETLRDHLPPLIDELAVELAKPHSESRELQMFCAHGEHRLKLGIPIAMVIDELRLLRRTIGQHAEHAGFALAGDAGNLIHEIIDKGIRAAVDTYIRRRDADEAKRREEHLTFVVHDLRSPLSAIYYAILLVERELAETGASERLRTIHATIKRNIERMQALIAKLLHEEENIRIGLDVRARRSLVTLWPIVESAIRVLNPLSTNANVKVTTQLDPELLVYADPELLERVFQNLIANAIEHAPDGSIVIGATRRDDGGVDIWASDNGKGIAPELQQKIFDKHQTNRREQGGLGLGLTVVKRIIEAHGGTVSVESVPDNGTTFYIFIPGT